MTSASPTSVSSEEAASVKDARERALQKAVEALGADAQRPWRPLLQDQRQVDDRVAVVLSGKVAGLISVETGEATASRPSPGGATRKRSPLPGRSTASTPWRPTSLTRRAGVSRRLTCSRSTRTSGSYEQRHRDLKQTLRVRPVFLHNDARIEALIAVVGIALLIFGLIEAELRAALGEGALLPGILPEGRAAKPTARAALAAFDGL